MLAVHRFAVAASLRIRTASLPHGTMTQFIPPQTEHVPPYQHPPLCFRPECKHGGPEPNEKIEDFLRAAHACKRAAGEAVRKLFVTTQYKGGMQGVEDDTDLVARTELRAIADFWSDEDRRRLLATPGALKCLYACAADSIHLAYSSDARFLARLGAWVEHPDDEEQLMRACRSTVSDWSTANYLNGKLPCGCLARLSSLEHCAGCLKYLDPTKAAIDKRLCKCCGTVAYCGVPCESADWPRHRLECSGRPSESEIEKQDAEWLERRDKAVAARASFEEISPPDAGNSGDWVEELNP